MKNILFIFLAVLYSACISAQEGDSKKVKDRAHPYLIMTTEDESVIRSAIQTDGVWKEYHAIMIEEADNILGKPNCQRVILGRRLLEVSRECLRRTLLLGYAYRMTGEVKYAKRAESELDNAADFVDWNPSHFLDVGEMVLALSIGYDWLYEYLESETRSIVRDAIVEKGLDAAAPDEWFYRAASNWNSVCNAGLLYGALAVFEDVPDKAKKIIERCLLTNPKALSAYGPDGGYPEGFHYWGYGTSFQVLLIAALESALGTDAGLSEYPGFLESARFMEFMTAPSGEYFNFSDAVNGVRCNMMMFWFAKKMGDLSLLWLENQYLENPSVCFAEDRLLPCLLIFCAHQDLSNIQPPSCHFWHNSGKTPVFIYRGGWNSKEDSYLAVKGGSPLTSHAHMDAGSFIYERKGIRWAIDLGMQNYLSLESRGINLWDQSQEGQRWGVFRLGNMAHNTLTINNKRHLVNSYASINRIYKSEDMKGAEVDLISVFADDMEKVVRIIYLNEEDDLIVKDELVTGEKEALVTWIMVTPAEAKIIGKNQMELAKDGHRMLLTVIAPGDVEMKLWSNEPLHAFDEPNPGSMRVGFETHLLANRKNLLKVTLNLIR